MFELWAKEREAASYKFIFSFSNEIYKYTAIDSLDTEKYREAMVLERRNCILYKEFEKPKVLKKSKPEK